MVMDLVDQFSLSNEFINVVDYQVRKLHILTMIHDRLGGLCLIVN